MRRPMARQPGRAGRGTARSRRLSGCPLLAPRELHWYVPEEIGMIDKAKSAGAEAVRDQIAQTIPARFPGD